MCNLIGSCENDYELFGYDLALNAPELYRSETDLYTNSSSKMTSHALRKKYCNVCGIGVSIEMEDCELCISGKL